MTADATRVGDDSPWYATPAGALDVAPHYRLTEVGPIPTQWRDAPLGEVAAVRAGGTPHRGNPTYWGGDIPWVTTAEVNGRTITEAHEYITELGLARSAARLEEPGTVLVALYGQGPTRGRVATLAIRAATNQACAAIIAKAGLVPQFLFHFLAGSYERLRSLSNKGSQDNLSGVLLRQFLVLVPPPSEQRAIAEALSDVDGLLGALEALIAKKRAIKQAAMQQLLTGKTRLPGFSGAAAKNPETDTPNDWRKIPLHAISSMHGRIGWQGLKQSEFTTATSDPFLITGVDFRDSGIDWDSAYHVSRDRYNLAPQIQLRPADVLMTKDGTIGKLLYVQSIPYPGMATLNSHLLVLRPINGAYVPRFLFYQLSSRRFADHIEQHKSGSTFFGLSQAATGRFLVLLPSVQEQQAIAAVLSNMDAEIAALEARRDKTRAIKQGMMQQLLTGRVRLVKPEAAA